MRVFGADVPGFAFADDEYVVLGGGVVKGGVLVAIEVEGSAPGLRLPKQGGKAFVLEGDGERGLLLPEGKDFLQKLFGVTVGQRDG